ncbi:hypothetical protein J6590_008473 [Homalodisca vitripennis]|nr:hypothetical protein J6590_008473 [Homalodisca vitripennis]
MALLLTDGSIRSSCTSLSPRLAPDDRVTPSGGYPQKHRSRAVSRAKSEEKMIFEYTDAALLRRGGTAGTVGQGTWSAPPTGQRSSHQLNRGHTHATPCQLTILNAT